MNYKILPTDKFQKEAKRLSKKYPSLKKDLEKLNQELSVNPKSGITLGHDTYKLRIAISSKGKGKSGGARVVTYVITADKEIYLLIIYDKSELANISDKELQRMVNEIKKLKK